MKRYSGYTIGWTFLYFISYDGLRNGQSFTLVIYQSKRREREAVLKLRTISFEKSISNIY
jgi:hypothetical protein